MKNVPNILSAFRIFLVPVFVTVFFLGGQYAHYWAAAVFLIAALTDFLDGYLARKYEHVTNLGKFLDPAGDKLMTLAMVICLSVEDIIPKWVPWFFIVKECLMVLGGIFYQQRISKDMLGANIIGKTATFALFCVGLSLMLFKIPRTVATWLMVVTAGLALAAFISYCVMLVGILKSRKAKS